MRIFHIGDDVLRTPSEPVKEINDDLRKLVKDMFETMYAASGVGLAAPQVGRNIMLFIVDVDGKSPMVFINPRIMKAVGKETADEGCLSIPGFREEVQRAKRVICRATDLDGQDYEVEAEGLMARAIQHEFDHLEGVLFVDRISKARKMQIRDVIERLNRGDLSVIEEIEEDEDTPMPSTSEKSRGSAGTALS